MRYSVFQQWNVNFTTFLSNTSENKIKREFKLHGKRQIQVENFSKQEKKKKQAKTAQNNSYG